ncbi:hypothetical protein JCM16303_001763 [Sporobolomyces ruberrimus]
MTDQLDRSNTTTTFSSFFCTGRKPSLNRPSPLERPPPPPNYQHVDDWNDNNDPPLAFNKVSYPRTGHNKSIDLRASRLGFVEKMSSKERIEKWNELTQGEGETEVELTPLEKWRLRVARETQREKKREEAEKETEERERRKREREESAASWGKPSVVTTSSMECATTELKKQFEQSSRESLHFVLLYLSWMFTEKNSTTAFARSFAIENLKTSQTADSAPSSSVVRESFLCDIRQPRHEHPYSHTFGFDEMTGALVAAQPPPRPKLGLNPSSEETLLVPVAPETCASVSPIDPAFAPGSYCFPLSNQRHPLPRIDTTNTPVTSTFSSSPVSAPVVSTYQAFYPPPRSSSLPFQDLESVHLSSPSPPNTSVPPPPVPPKDTPRNLDASFSILPPKAAALLGLIATSHPLGAIPRPPKPSFARDRQGSSHYSGSNASASGSPSISTGQYRSSFYTNYDGPNRPSVDSTTPTTMTSPSTNLGHRAKNSSSTGPAQRGPGRRTRPPPLSLKLEQGMNSLPDLRETPRSQARFNTPTSSSLPSPGSSVSSSLDLSLQAGRSNSLDTPRLPNPYYSNGGHRQLETNETSLYQSHSHYYQSHSRSRTMAAETEVESLLDAPMHVPFPSIPKATSSRFGTSIGQDLTRSTKSGGGGGGLRTRSSGSQLARSVSQKGKGLARKLSLKTISQPERTSTSKAAQEKGRTTSKKVASRKSLKDLKKGLDQKLENSFRYW